VTADARGRVVGVELFNSAGDDQTLRLLDELPELRSLRLTGTRVSDAGLVRLKRWTALESLYIDGAFITDRTLTHIALAKQLKRVHLRWANVSDEAVGRLREALPGAEIIVVNRPAFR
jgi:hypothetical protein